MFVVCEFVVVVVDGGGGGMAGAVVVSEVVVVVGGGGLPQEVSMVMPPMRAALANSRIPDL